MTFLSPPVNSKERAFSPIWQAFTIIELLVAMVILTIILTVIFGITQQTGNAWKGTSSKIEAFQGARAAFDAITRNLSQATLNTYYDYDNPASPTRYMRKSDLHFISGKSLVDGQVGHSVFFQTPASYSDAPDYQNLDSLLNACGYFVRYEKNPSRPPFLSGVPNAPADRYRFRLMQFMQPSQQFSVYAQSTGNNWFNGAVAVGSSSIQTMAENVVALVILPKSSDQDGGAVLAPVYEYDSRGGGNTTPQVATQNQLPPLVEVIMVAIDEPSAKRLSGDSSTAPDLGMSGLFLTASELETNLQALENTLIAKRLTYRVFRTTVPLRNAKWSS